VSRYTSSSDTVREIEYQILQRTALALALAIVAATPALAQKPRPEYVAPPVEFDRPFDGLLIMVPARDQNHVRELCPGAVFSMGIALACSRRLTHGCRVVMIPDEQITAVGFPPDLVRRHEIAHCNGWPADHRGALPHQEWAVPR
jgi:hypothetical protein